MSKMSKAIAVLGVVAGLGVAALPLSSYAATTDTTTAQAVVGESIEIAITDTDNYVKINGGNAITASDGIMTGDATVNVKTNAAKGYTITIKDNDTTTDLSLVGGDAGAKSIPAVALTDSSALGWGFKASSTEGGNVSTGVSADYRAIKTEDQILATGTGPSADAGDDFTLTFGVKVDNTIPAGTYEDEVILTAATK